LNAQWLCPCPRLNEFVFDNVGEFIVNEYQELLASNGIKSSPTTVKNPTGNASMGDMLQTTQFLGTEWFHELNRTLQAVAWAVRSTVTNTGYSPGQLSVNRDMLMETKIKEEWLAAKAIRVKNA